MFLRLIMVCVALVLLFLIGGVMIMQPSEAEAQGRGTIEARRVSTYTVCYTTRFASSIAMSCVYER